MQLIRPRDITPTVLTSSNVPENDYPEWVAGTYNLGIRVIIAAQHTIYEVVAPVSTTDSPLVGIAKAVPTWVVVGPTNRWRMFDSSVGTLTTNPGSIVVVLTPGKVINSLALFNLAGRSVRVTMVDSVDGMVYDRTLNLVAGVTNWYEYFFSEIETRTDIVITDMPAYGTASVTVTITSNTGSAAVGHLAIGTIEDLGCAAYGASVGAISYSRKDRDAFGNPIIVKRSNAKTAGFDISFDTARLATIQRILIDLDAVPVVWIGSPLPQYEATVVFGFYRDFSLNYEGPKISRGSINVEGVT